MPTWRSLRVDGLGPIQRVASVFQIGPPLGWLSFPSFKVKVLERVDGSFLGVLNVAVRGHDGSPEWTSGLGATVEEALEDALNRFVETLCGRGDLPDESFAWAGAGEI
jgi:hypothetical protein